jgi:hypothetical protein
MSFAIVHTPENGTTRPNHVAHTKCSELAPTGDMVLAEPKINFTIYCRVWERKLGSTDKSW